MATLPLTAFTHSRLKQTNIGELQSLCRREGISWRNFKTKGRKKEYIAALMNHVNAERDAGHDIAVEANNQIQRPQHVDHEAIVNQFIARNGLPAICDVDPNDNDNNNNNRLDMDAGDEVIVNMVNHDRGGNNGDDNDGNNGNDNGGNNGGNIGGNNGGNNGGNIGGNNGGNIGGNIGGNNGDDNGGNNGDEQKNIEFQGDNSVEEDWEKVQEFLTDNGLEVYETDLYDNGFDAMDIICECSPEAFVGIIRKKGHRVKLVHRATRYTQQLASGDGDDGHGNVLNFVANGVAAMNNNGPNGHNHNNNGSVAISPGLKLDFEATMMNRALFCDDATDTSLLRVQMDNAKAPKKYDAITNVRDPVTFKRINTGHKIAIGIALLLHEWKLFELRNFYDPNAARLEAPRGRGGNKWFKADIFLRRGPSEAYHLLADDKKEDFKENIIKKYKKWINWKRLAHRKGDYGETMRLFGDIL